MGGFIRPKQEVVDTNVEMAKSANINRDSWGLLRMEPKKRWKYGLVSRKDFCRAHYWEKVSSFACQATLFESFFLSHFSLLIQQIIEKVSFPLSRKILAEKSAKKWKAKREEKMSKKWNTWRPFLLFCPFWPLNVNSVLFPAPGQKRAPKTNWPSCLISLFSQSKRPKNHLLKKKEEGQMVIVPFSFVPRILVAFAVHERSWRERAAFSLFRRPFSTSFISPYPLRFDRLFCQWHRSSLTDNEKIGKWPPEGVSEI